MFEENSKARQIMPDVEIAVISEKGELLDDIRKTVQLKGGQQRMKYACLAILFVGSGGYLVTSKIQTGRLDYTFTLAIVCSLIAVYTMAYMRLVHSRVIYSMLTVIGAIGWQMTQARIETVLMRPRESIRDKMFVFMLSVTAALSILFPRIAIVRLVSAGASLAALVYLFREFENQEIISRDVVFRCKTIQYNSETKDCIQAVGELNKAFFFSSLAPLIIAAIGLIIESFKLRASNIQAQNHEIHQQATTQNQRKSNYKIQGTSLVILIAALLVLSAIPAVRQESTKFVNLHPLVVLQTRENPNSKLKITGKPGSIHNGRKSLILRSFDIDVSSMTYELNEKVGSLNKIDKFDSELTLITQKVSIVAELEGYHSIYYEMTEKNNQRTTFDFIPVVHQEENVIYERSLVLEHSSGKVCYLSKIHPYCPTARYDLDQDIILLVPDDHWTVSSAKDHPRLPQASTRRLQAAVHVALPRDSASFMVKTYMDIHQNLYVLMASPHYGVVILMKNNEGLAKEVHLEQHDTDDGYVSFVKDRSSNQDIIGYLYLSKQKLIEITKDQWERLCSIPPETIEEGNIKISRIVFEHGISLDGSYENLAKASVYIRWGSKFSNLINDVLSGGQPINLNDSLCDDCLQTIPRPLAKGITRVQDQAGHVLVNIEKLTKKRKYSKCLIDSSDSDNTTIISLTDQTIHIDLTCLSDTINSQIADPVNTIFDRDSHMTLLKRDLEELYILNSGHMFGVTGEDMLQMVRALEEKLYDTAPMVLKQKTYTEAKGSSVRRPYFYYKKQRFEVDINQLSKFVANPNNEPQLSYKIYSGTSKIYYEGNQILLPRRCLAKIYAIKRELLVHSLQLPPGINWPAVDLFDNKQTKRLYLNIGQLIADYKDCSNNDSCQWSLKDCGLEIDDQVGEKPLPTPLVSQKPSFFVKSTSFKSDFISPAALISTMGYAIIEPVKWYDYPKRFGCIMIKINSEPHWLDYRRLKKLILASDLLNKWVKNKKAEGFRAINQIDIRLEMAKFVEKSGQHYFKNDTFDEKGYGTIRFHDLDVANNQLSERLGLGYDGPLDTADMKITSTEESITSLNGVAGIDVVLYKN